MVIYHSSIAYYYIGIISFTGRQYQQTMISKKAVEQKKQTKSNIAKANISSSVMIIAKPTVSVCYTIAVLFA